MVSQVIFKIDKKLKQDAMKKAQKEGVAFSAILKLATKAYVEGELDVTLSKPEKFNAATRKELREALKDIKAGRNLSPAFDNVRDMMAYLEKP
jgi:antitoxin component of RelBE/YafQ-DinJ toxin-antitoxin module